MSGNFFSQVTLVWLRNLDIPFKWKSMLKTSFRETVRGTYTLCHQLTLWYLCSSAVTNHQGVGWGWGECSKMLSPEKSYPDPLEDEDKTSTLAHAWWLDLQSTRASFISELVRKRRAWLHTLKSVLAKELERRVHFRFPQHGPSEVSSANRHCSQTGLTTGPKEAHVRQARGSEIGSQRRAASSGLEADPSSAACPSGEGTPLKSWSSAMWRLRKVLAQALPSVP